MSIAVLPFENRSPDTADVYIAEGMTDEIANQLARLGRLQVRARSTVLAQWRRTPDPLDAARKLGVAWIVHGHVRNAGSQLVVNVELVRTATGEETWAARFPRRTADVFAVQAEVAESVSVAVGARLTPKEKAILARRPTTSNEAYRLYLLGNSLSTRRTPAELRRAVDAYTTATRLDPRFAAAWARLARAQSLQLNYDRTLAPKRDSILPTIRTAIRRAMALDSMSSDAWLADGSLGYASPTRTASEVAQSRTSLERAVRLDTLNEEAVGSLGFFYAWFPVDASRADPLLRRALTLNPDRRVSWLHLFFVRWHSGRIAEAGAMLDTLQMFGPWAPGLGRRAEFLHCAGDDRGALAVLDEAERIDSTRGNDFLRSLFKVGLGDSTAARTMLARGTAVADSAQQAGVGEANQSGRALTLARLHNVLGQRHEAIAMLEAARTDPDLWREMNNPCFAPLRSDSRFLRLLEEARPRY
jgi:TolB-like protein/tetratricopeptide (TPR) repeat protein